MAGGTLSEPRPRRWTRLLVAAAAIMPLLTMLALADGYSKGDVVFGLLAGVVPALPLVARTSLTFMWICLVEGPLLVVIGFWLAIGGLFILIPSAIALIVAGLAEMRR